MPRPASVVVALFALAITIVILESGCPPPTSAVNANNTGNQSSAVNVNDAPPQNVGPIVEVTLRLPSGWADKNISDSERKNRGVRQHFASPDPSLPLDAQRNLPKGDILLRFIPYPADADERPAETMERFSQDYASIDAVRHYNENPLRNGLSTFEREVNMWWAEFDRRERATQVVRERRVWWYYRYVPNGPGGAAGMYKLEVDCVREYAPQIARVVPGLVEQFRSD